MITTYLAWIAIAVGIAAVLSRDGMKPSSGDTTSTAKPLSRSAFFSLIVLALAALLAAWKWKSQSPDVLPSALGFTAGVLVSLLAQSIGASKFQMGASIAGPLGLAVAVQGLGSIHQLPDWLLGHEVGLGLGVAVGAWVLTGFGKEGDGWPVRLAVFLNTILLADILGKLAAPNTASHAGLFIAAAVAFFAAAVPSVLVIVGGNAKSRGAVATGAFCALIVGASWLIATRYVWLPDLWKIAAASVLVAIIVNWFLPKESDESALPHLLAAVMWLGMATIAFAFLRGFGMAVALLAAASVLLFLDNRPGLLTLGPLAAMTVYRVFKEMHTSAAKALDIGQHYGLIGLIAGMALLGLAIESRRRRPEIPVASSAMAVLMMAVPVIAAVLIAAKGYVGVLVGMGFSFLIVGAPRLRTALPLAMQMGIGLLMAGAYGWFEAIIDLSRDEKVKALMYAVPAVAVMIGIVYWLTRVQGSAGRLKPAETAAGAPS